MHTMSCTVIVTELGVIFNYNYVTDELQQDDKRILRTHVYNDNSTNTVMSLGRCG